MRVAVPVLPASPNNRSRKGAAQLKRRCHRPRLYRPGTHNRSRKGAAQLKQALDDTEAKAKAEDNRSRKGAAQLKLVQQSIIHSDREE